MRIDARTSAFRSPWLALAAVVCLVGGLSTLARDRRDRAEEVGGDWVRLGERKVDWHSDEDTIDVGASEGRYRALKLEVRDADIELIKLVVKFGSGDDETLEFRQRVPQGSMTRRIELSSHDRIIKKVRMYYKTMKDQREKAHVVLYGER